MRTATWKQVERRTAQRLGGKRLGATGVANADVLTSWSAVEVKHRKALPAWLTGALGKIRGQAGSGRLGMVVLHESGRHDSLVVLSLADFGDWFGTFYSGGEDVADAAQTVKASAEVLTTRGMS